MVIRRWKIPLITYSHSMCRIAVQRVAESDALDCVFILLLLQFWSVWELWLRAACLSALILMETWKDYMSWRCALTFPAALRDTSLSTLCQAAPFKNQQSESVTLPIKLGCSSCKGRVAEWYLWCCLKKVHVFRTIDNSLSFEWIN